MTRIYCLTTDKDVQSFYIEACGETHYLFSQNFRRGVKEYFRGGVHLDAALDLSRAKNNTALIKTMKKLSSYIRYIEKEYGLEILRQTIRKNSGYRYGRYAA